VSEAARRAQSLDDAIAVASRAPSTEEAFATLVAALRARRFEHVCFSLVTDHPALALSAAFALLGTCPSDWVERYRATGLVQTDPLWRRLYEAEHAVEYRPLSGTAATAAARAAFTAWGELGCRSAVVVPLRSSGGALAALIATSPSDRSLDPAELCAASLLSVHFHGLYLQRRAAPAPAEVALTDAERQVLIWSARGKTKKEIAIVLGTSPHTVDYHQRKLLKKLAVSSVAAAVARAIALRLLLQ
jgi:DNA-binding CsgD family transcriptional regulator